MSVPSRQPERAIYCEEDLENFKTSSTFNEIFNFAKVLLKLI